MKILTITNENFEQEVLQPQTPIIVDFWAPWCGYCRRIAPVLDLLAEEYDGKAAIAKVNIDEQPELAERFGIETIPTLLLFQGGAANGELVAPESKAQISGWLKEHGIS